jgi:hypothetical protein
VAGECIRPEFGAVLVLSTYFLHISEFFAIVLSRNDQGRRAGGVKQSRHGKRGLRAGVHLNVREAIVGELREQNKNAFGGPRKSLIRLKTDKEIQAFPLGWASLDLAQFGWIWRRFG